MARLCTAGGACFAVPDLCLDSVTLFVTGACSRGLSQSGETRVEIRQAVDLKGDADLLPNNCITFSVIRRGVLALAGGDYEGDVILFISDLELLEFLASTPGGDKVGDEATIEAAQVRQRESVFPSGLWFTAAQFPHYRRAASLAPMQRALLAAWKSRRPQHSGALHRAVQLRHIAHKACCRCRTVISH